MIALLTNKKGGRRRTTQVHLRYLSLLFVFLFLLMTSVSYFPLLGLMEMEQWEISQEAEKEGESKQKETKEESNLDVYIPLSTGLAGTNAQLLSAQGCHDYHCTETCLEVFTPPPERV